jgi:hypothetical protein
MLLQTVSNAKGRGIQRVPMVKPEDGIEGRYFYDAHVAQTEDIVQSIMKGLKVPNDSTAGLIADLAEWLIGGKELVEHVSKIWLLFANALVDLIVATGGIYRKPIERVTKGVIPTLEAELALLRC